MGVERPVVEFDQYGPDYARNWRSILADMRENCPIAWSNSYDGFWIVTKYDDIVHCERNPQIFSCDNDLNNERSGARGIRIPRNPFRFNLNESDPPEHTELRKLEAPFFSVQSLQDMMAFARARTEAQIDTIIEQGHGDLVEDVCVPVPAQVALQLTGMPTENWQDYMRTALNSYLPTDHPDYPLAARLRIMDLISEVMADRRANPRADVISALVHAQVNGAPLSPEVAGGMVISLVVGGFDTTAATAANALEWLEQHPELHQRLIEDDAYLAKAVDEFLRYFPPLVGGLARTVMEDTELRGQKLSKGERVLLMYNSGNFDEDRFESPDVLDIDRRNAKQHLAFGAGPHRCIGAVLGAADVGIVIRGVLKRLPDYRIDHSRARRFPSLGGANGWITMPITFTPGRRSTSGQ